MQQNCSSYRSQVLDALGQRPRQPAGQRGRRYDAALRQPAATRLVSRPQQSVLPLDGTGGLRRVQHPKVQVAHHVLQQVVVGRPQERHHGRVGAQVGQVATAASGGFRVRGEERCAASVGHFGVGGGGSRQSSCNDVLLADLLLLPGEAAQHVGQVDGVLHQLLALLLLRPVEVQG